MRSDPKNLSIMRVLRGLHQRSKTKSNKRLGEGRTNLYLPITNSPNSFAETTNIYPNIDNHSKLQKCTTYSENRFIVLLGDLPGLQDGKLGLHPGKLRLLSHSNVRKCYFVCERLLSLKDTFDSERDWEDKCQELMKINSGMDPKCSLDESLVLP